jgi:uncharacterized protein GlcG (DUF336 family)
VRSACGSSKVGVRAECGGGRRCFYSVHSVFAACAQRVRSVCVVVVDRGGERVEAPHENEARAHMPALIALQVACVSIRQHTSAYVSIRHHTSAYVSGRMKMKRIYYENEADVSIRQHTSADA